MRLVAIALLAALVLGCGSAHADGRHLRVLFVGNSLTAANDLPGTVAAIARARHVTIETRTFAPGGYALEDHWAAGDALAALRAGGWDAVVLQQGPSSLQESRDNLIEWSKRWADEARAHGTRPALLTVWPESARSYVFADVVRNYHDAAVAAGAGLFPAGLAWRRVLAKGVKLYGPDGFHPSPLGSYLAALVVYAGLTGELPRTLPSTGVKLDPRTALVLRAAASSALRTAR
jgi:hypothetical protein